MNTSILAILLAAQNADLTDDQSADMLEALYTGDRNDLITDIVAAHQQAKNGLNKLTADRILEVLNTLMNG